jgi:hypothetical protein
MFCKHDEKVLDNKQQVNNPSLFWYNKVIGSNGEGLA